MITIFNSMTLLHIFNVDVACANWHATIIASLVRLLDSFGKSCHDIIAQVRPFPSPTPPIKTQAAQDLG